MGKKSRYDEKMKLYKKTFWNDSLPIYKYNCEGKIKLLGPFKKLSSILTLGNPYVYTSTAGDIDPAVVTSVFRSAGRVTPVSQFIALSGPTLPSIYASELEPGNEVIFLKLPDYIYEIEYTVKGDIVNIPQLWRVSAAKNLSFQIYDVCGNLAYLKGTKGIIQIYGFNKFVDVWSPDDLQITLKVTAIEHLKPDFNPFSPGEHSINFESNNKCKSIVVYDNVYNSATALTTRIVVPELEEVNRILRKQYFANFKGCAAQSTQQTSQQPSIQQLAQQATALDSVTITIEGNATVVDYNTKVFFSVGSASAAFLCSLEYWILLDIANQTPTIQLTDTLGIDRSIAASYVWFGSDGWVEINVNNVVLQVSGVGSDTGNDRIFLCQNAATLSLINYYSGIVAPTYNEVNGSIVGTSQLQSQNTKGFDPELDDYINFTWNGKFIIKVIKGEYYKFVINNAYVYHGTEGQTLVGGTFGGPLTGSFNVSYLAVD